MSDATLACPYCGSDESTLIVQSDDATPPAAECETCDLIFLATQHRFTTNPETED